MAGRSGLQGGVQSDALTMSLPASAGSAEQSASCQCSIVGHPGTTRNQEVLVRALGQGLVPENLADQSGEIALPRSRASPH